MADLTLLHISDLHFGQPEGELLKYFEKPQVMSALLEMERALHRAIPSEWAHRMPELSAVTWL